MTLHDLALTRATSSPGALPDDKTTKALLDAVTTELRASETDRAEHMARVTEWWDVYNLERYRPEALMMAEQMGLTLPTTRARIDQAHGSLYAALAVAPFYQAEVGEGEDGTIAIHAQEALGEELERCEFENALDVALRGSLVGSIGMFKATTLEDEQGHTRIDVEAVDIRDLYLSPHNVRDLEQCTMIAHAWEETLGWVRDQALSGFFDEKAVRKIVNFERRDEFDGGQNERQMQSLPELSATLSDESRKVTVHECYIRYRPRPNPDKPYNPDEKWKAAELWRVYLERGSNVILRAEKWEDGFPFSALRHQRGQTTIYAPSFPNVLKDIQWYTDQLMSAALEADRMSVAPIWEVETNSLAMQFFKNRSDSLGGAAVRPVPGDIIPKRGAGDSMKPIYFQPAPPQVDARMNRLENLANIATIPVLPMQTYRSATEHRYAMGQVSAKEQQMLKVLRADLTRLGEKIKRLYFKYVATALGMDFQTGEEIKQIRHGVTAYTVTGTSWNMLRLTPRGMTTAADQMMTMQASQEALTLQMQILPQKPMLEQAGLWPLVWYALSRRLDALGIQDYEQYIGPNPVSDPQEEVLDPAVKEKQMQASMMLMQANNPAGGAGVMQAMLGGGLPGVNGEQVRGSDGAPTVPPGGAPNGQGMN